MLDERHPNHSTAARILKFGVCGDQSHHQKGEFPGETEVRIFVLDEMKAPKNAQNLQLMSSAVLIMFFMHEMPLALK